MKTQHQVVLVALAILFTIALAITIAMLCVSALQKNSENTEEPVYPPEWTQPFISNEPLTSALPESTDTELSQTTYPVCDLAFVSNRNGTCTLTGIGTSLDSFIVIPQQSPQGDMVTAIAPKAFMGCDQITAVQIPETVIMIGNLAFANCPNLIYISVDKYNPYYKDVDGVLYNAEGTQLLLYPPMHVGNSVYLPVSVTEIADMAFYQCAYLSAIRYEGTAEQWHLIDVGVKNYSLTASAIVFSVRTGA